MVLILAVNIKYKPN